MPTPDGWAHLTADYLRGYRDGATRALRRAVEVQADHTTALREADRIEAEVDARLTDMGEPL